MIRYLDTDRNLKSQPNENYARELLELFTMGEGNYTENDIKEAARAFTGWTVERDSNEFTVRKGQHDTGTKKFLGRMGSFDGDEIVDIILDQKATAEFIARKFWRFFAGADPEPILLQALAKNLQKHKFHLKPFLRAMFLSDAFYAAELRFQNIKSPVELLVGSFRLLEVKPFHVTPLSRELQKMGQQLLQPPNVKGWDGGKKWINAATLYHRYNFSRQLLYGSSAAPRGRKAVEKMMEMIPEDWELTERDPASDQPPFNPRPILEDYRLNSDSPEKLLDHWIERLIQQELSPQERELLLQHLNENTKGKNSENAIRGTIHLMMTLPHYQVS